MLECDTHSSAVEPAPENMNEAQRKLWQGFCTHCKSCGSVAAYQTYKSAFKLNNLVLSGANAFDEEEKNTAHGDMDTCWFRAVHSPHDLSFHVEWNLPKNYTADSRDCIYLLKIEHVDTSVYVASAYNHNAVRHGEAQLSFHNEILNSPGLEYYICYKKRDEEEVIAHTTVTTISREEEKTQLLGEVTVELLTVDKQLVIAFDLTGMPDFVPQVADTLVVVEECNHHNHQLLSVAATSELSGITYINFTLELSNHINYNVRYVHQQKVIAISNVITCTGITETVNCEDCQLNADFDPTSCSVQVSWQFTPESTLRPKQTQHLILYKVSEVDMADLKEYQKLSILVSGKRKGTVSMLLKGAVQNDETYALHYIEQSLQKCVSYGSTRFLVAGVSAADADETQISTTWTHNAKACMRYLVDEAANMSETEANPLLSVTIDKEYSLTTFAETFNQGCSVVDGCSSTGAQIDGLFDPIEELDLQNELFERMDIDPLVRTLVVLVSVLLMTS